MSNKLEELKKEIKELGTLELYRLIEMIKIECLSRSKKMKAKNGN